MSAPVCAPRPAGAAFAAVSAAIPACNTALDAERERQSLALERAIARQLEQRAAAAALEQSNAVQRGAAAPPAAGGGATRGWFSMWQHDMELDQLFYPLAAGMWVPYIMRLWPVATPAERVQHVGQATAILLLAALAW